MDVSAPPAVQASSWSSFVLFWSYISTVPASFKLTWKGFHMFMRHRKLFLKIEFLKGFRESEREKTNRKGTVNSKMYS